MKVCYKHKHLTLAAIMNARCQYIVLINLPCPLQGRIVEIYGREASGKTTLALHVIKEAQNLGGTH